MKIALGSSILLLALVATVASAQGRITRVSTSTITLKPGGESVELTLEGQQLATVSAYRLLRNGRPVTGLRAVRNNARSVLGQTRTDALTVDLSIEGTVAAGRYQLELVSGGEQILVPVSIDVLTSSLRDESLTSDGIVITGVRHYPTNAREGDPYTFVVTVQNRGSGPAAAIVTESRSPHCIAKGEPTGPLQPGESRELTDPSWAHSTVVAAGTYTCSFALANDDNEPTIPGTQFSYTYTVADPPPPAPDLRISNVTILCLPTECDDPDHVRESEKYRLHVWVQNVGAGFHSSGTSISITATCGIPPKQEFHHNLAPAAQVPLTLEPGPGLMSPAGPRSCRFVVSGGADAGGVNKVFDFSWTIHP